MLSTSTQMFIFNKSSVTTPKKESLTTFLTMVDEVYYD